MHIATGPGPHIDAVVELAAQASADHDRFVFESDEQAAHVHRELLQRGASDCSEPYCQLLIDGNEVRGLTAAMSGRDLATARIRMAMAMASSGLFAPGSAIRERMKLASRTRSQVGEDDYYLARIAVAKPARGRGYGRTLLEAVISKAHDSGCARLLLDVASGNADAIALYERHGFVHAGADAVEDVASGRRLEHLHMVKVLTAQNP